MPIWGKPKDYAWLYSVSKTDQYRFQLLRWLEWENPELHKLVLKEISREAPRGKAPQDPAD